MTDLAGIPFIRENVIFKQFLDFEKNYILDDDYDARRTLLIQPANAFHHTHSLTSSSLGRPS